MAGYELIGSYSTVQVLSSTVVNEVVYCTIQTLPSGVICSTPINSVFFDAGTSGTLLTHFAESVETVMAFPEVVAGVGSQTIDPSGLLADNVVFTVQYIPPGSTSTAVTAEAVVPVVNLNFSDPSSAGAQEAAVNTIIQDVLANLVSAAGSTAFTGTASAAPQRRTTGIGPTP